MAMRYEAAIGPDSPQTAWADDTAAPSAPGEEPAADGVPASGGAGFATDAERAERCARALRQRWLVADLGGDILAGLVRPRIEEGVEAALAQKGAVPPICGPEADAGQVARDQWFRVCALGAPGLLLCLPPLLSAADSNGRLSNDDAAPLVAWLDLCREHSIELVFDEGDRMVEAPLPQRLDAVVGPRPGLPLSRPGIVDSAPLATRWEDGADEEHEVGHTDPPPPNEPELDLGEESAACSAVDLSDVVANPSAFAPEPTLTSAQSEPEPVEEPEDASEEDALDDAEPAEVLAEAEVFTRQPAEPVADSLEADGPSEEPAEAVPDAMVIANAENADDTEDELAPEIPSLEVAEVHASEPASELPETSSERGPEPATFGLDRVLEGLSADVGDDLEEDAFDAEMDRLDETMEAAGPEHAKYHGPAVVIDPHSGRPAEAPRQPGRVNALADSVRAHAPADPRDPAHQAHPFDPSHLAHPPEAPPPISARTNQLIASAEWRAIAHELDAAQGPKPVRVVEQLFRSRYMPLLSASGRGETDGAIDDVVDNWGEQFASSYTDAFSAIRVTGKRPNMVLDAPDIAARIARVNGARSTCLLLVDSMRFDIAERVAAGMRDDLGPRAVLVERTMLWSALPTNTPTQMQLLARGPEALRDASLGKEGELDVARGRAVSTLRRIRIGQREVMKLDLVEARMRTAGPDVEQRMDLVAEEVIAVISKFVDTLPVRTLLFVFGDHGFRIRKGPNGWPTGSAEQGGASPEEVLVCGHAWLVDGVH